MLSTMTRHELNLPSVKKVEKENIYARNARQSREGIVSPFVKLLVEKIQTYQIKTR